MSVHNISTRRPFALKNFKLSTKITTAFLIIAVIVCIVGGIGIWALGNVHAKSQELSNGSFTGPKQVSAIQTDVLSIERKVYLSRIVTTATGSQQYLTQVKSDEQTLQNDWATYAVPPFGATEGALVSQYQAAFTDWNQTLQTLLPLIAQNTDAANQQADALVTTTWEAQSTALLKPIAALSTFQNDEGIAQQQSITMTYYQMRWLIGVVMALSVLIAITLGQFISKMVVNPLREIARVLQRMSQGELNEITHLVTRLGNHDAIGEIATALNNTIIQLRSLIGNFTKMTVTMSTSSDAILESAQQTNAATEQVSQTIQQVSIGAQDQSSQLNVATDVMDTLSQQSQIMQSKAEETIKIMATLKDDIQTTEQKMSGVATRSDEIGQIVQTINDLADQTNLLALNAAIEAARAGDQGRGFAVVADEVRKLAERSASATQDIRNVITTMQDETHQAVTAMQKGVAQVEISATHVQETETAARAMAEQIQHVNQAIVTVASVSEENSAAAEEVTAATEEMTAQVSEMLNSIMSIKTIATDLYQVVLVFHWDDPDNGSVRGMQPSDSAPYHPVPVTREKLPDGVFRKAA